MKACFSTTAALLALLPLNSWSKRRTRKMITVLLAALAVASRGLQMATTNGANPHLRPCGRNGQGTNAPQLLGIAYSFSVRSDVAKVFAASLEPDAGLVVTDVTQSGRAGRCNRIGDQVEIAGMRSPLETPAGFANDTPADRRRCHGLPHSFHICRQGPLCFRPISRPRHACAEQNGGAKKCQQRTKADADPGR